MKKVLSYADSNQINYVVLIGSREFEEGKVTVKDMNSGEQETVEISDIESYMKTRCL